MIQIQLYLTLTPITSYPAIKGTTIQDADPAFEALTSLALLVKLTDSVTRSVGLAW